MNKNLADFGSASLNAEAKAFADDCASYFDYSHTRMQTIPREDLAQLQLAALTRRFSELRPQIAMLENLADRQGIKELESLDDVVPVLFEHTMYKSYPPSLLDSARFTDVNRWLSKLTSYDLTSIDVSRCETIDDWMDTMDRESSLDIAHSSGTSGTMSFLPISKNERDKHGRVRRVCSFQPFGSDVDPREDVEIYCVYPYFRSGGSSHLRGNEITVKHIVGSEDRFLAAFPGRMSSDVLYLAAKVKAAQARGELDRLQISPRLLERQKEFEALQADVDAHLSEFFERAFAQLRGKRIFFGGTWNILHGLASKGLAAGMEGLFTKNSLVFSGGGAKGMTPPENWKADVCRFIGIDQINMSYGMSEVQALHEQCEHGHYHFVPWVIPFLLDPETSKPLPRHGLVTGRAAFFDLHAETHWGGFITGDEVTINWDTPCACGRTSVYIEGEIQRFSEKNGGDDKISCAATESAHEEAMDFLTSFGS